MTNRDGGGVEENVGIRLEGSGEGEGEREGGRGKRILAGLLCSNIAVPL